MIFTGNVTITLEKEDEETLRSIAGSRYNNKKGSMAKVLGESLRLLSSKTEKNKAMIRQFKWMDQGFNLGKIKIKARGEIYDRR